MQLSGKEGLHVIGREIRRKAILNALLVRKQDTIANLAAEFDVSIRTVKLDVQDLMCSYPIETVRGRHGGVRVVEWFHPTQSKMNPEQVSLLIRLSKDLSKEDFIILNSILVQFAQG